MPRSKARDYFRTQTCRLSPLLSWAVLPTPPSPANVLGWSGMSSGSHSSWTYAEISTSPHLTTIITGRLNKSLAFPVFQGTIRLIKLYHWSGIHLNSCQWAEGTAVSDSYFWCHDWLTGTVDGRTGCSDCCCQQTAASFLQVTACLSWSWSNPTFQSYCSIREIRHH